jgi:hypothetical protein
MFLLFRRLCFVRHSFFIGNLNLLEALTAVVFALLAENQFR